ncbi:hypothetical protein GNI_063890 [Gregarina niphandrodes]|uniref:Transmembrane protein n=1 Tax=Gregarina niphandrodes TaxID=110365 RepID=A0A023B840_GRENI|nr:hypothetical protein GNI_063890 [Gregarina niphandrodes]EZG68169.1 hypothetical protein GNI_063890 [Gregarina niphandrodes]|eukprot:XP_011130063.1 hypothetical protein GNI_063890 [Gregarina niphandrodes]
MQFYSILLLATIAIGARTNPNDQKTFPIIRKDQIAKSNDGNVKKFLAKAEKKHLKVQYI